MFLTATIAHAILFTVFLWWFTTGAILYLDGLPKRTFKVSMAVASLVLIGSLYGLWATQNDTTVWGAYLAFTLALLAWGWNEMAFLMGIVTGPRTTACPPEAQGFERLKFATQTVLWHELAIAATAAVIFILTATGSNQVGFQTFAILWVLRLSAKVNIFMGVRNFSEEFLPDHLRYLQTYFRRASMNAVFPISVTATTILFAYLAGAMTAENATPFEMTAAALLCTLAALALLEHWLMILPISATLLWKWGLASRQGEQELAAEPPPASRPAAGLPVVAIPISAPLPGLACNSPRQTIIVPFPALSTTSPRRRS